MCRDPLAGSGWLITLHASTALLSLVMGVLIFARPKGTLRPSPSPAAPERYSLGPPPCPPATPRAPASSAATPAGASDRADGNQA